MFTPTDSVVLIPEVPPMKIIKGQRKDILHIITYNNEKQIHVTQTLKMFQNI